MNELTDGLTELSETEAAHKNAMIELESMRMAMDNMEEERAQLVAEVELQIERALQSMTLSLADSDSEEGAEGSELDEAGTAAGSRPASKLGRRSRSSSNAVRMSPRTQSIDSATLAGTQDGEGSIRHSLESSITEEDEEVSGNPSPPAVSTTTNIDAADPVDRTQDAMVAVDEGIHSNSDRIAQSVAQIQQKLEALANPNFARWRASLDSETETSDRERTRRRRVDKLDKVGSGRTRSSTASSQTTVARTPNGKKHSHSKSDKSISLAPTPKALDSPIKATHTISKPSSAKSEKSVSPTSTVESPISATTTSSPSTLTSPAVSNEPITPSATFAPTEDSDTDFQSAYSSSPRDSYADSDDEEAKPKPKRKPSTRKEKILDESAVREVVVGLGSPTAMEVHTRDRVSSAATARVSNVVHVE